MMFASIQSKDIPWRAGQTVTVKTAHTEEHDYTWVMREFRQHNEPNPILVRFRKQVAKTGEHPYWGDGWDATMDYLDFAQDFPHLSFDKPDHVGHARKVLTRLANLAEKEN